MTVKATKKISDRISQGDIYKDIEYIQRVELKPENRLEVHKIVFPLVVVLTQDCDLQQDSVYYKEETDVRSEDKKLLSIIAAPLYNEDLFLNGEHLGDETINYRMQKIQKKKKGKPTTKYSMLMQNEIPRYHHLQFHEDVLIVDSVVDFKHYFSIDIESLMMTRRSKFVCQIDELFRERLTQRFANFLARIGLPSGI